MCADERFHQLTKLTFYQRFPMKITMMIMYFVITVDTPNRSIVSRKNNIQKIFHFTFCAVATNIKFDEPKDVKYGIVLTY